VDVSVNPDDVTAGAARIRLAPGWKNHLPAGDTELCASGEVLDFVHYRLYEDASPLDLRDRR
jgi:hypothetical protein